MVVYIWAASLLEQQAHHMEAWALDQDHRGQGQGGSLHLQVVPMTRWVLGESLQLGMQGKSRGQLEGGMHLVHLVHTCHCLLPADHQGKAHLGKAQVELQGLKGMVQLGREQDLLVAVLEHLQVDTAQETARGLQGWRGTAPELLVLVDIVQVSQDQVGTHQGLKEVLGTAPVLQDLRGTGTVPVPQGRMIHRRSHPEQRAGWELLGLNQAILGL